MDKTKVKSFSVWARRNLIKAVAKRALKIGVEKNSILEVEECQHGFKIKGKVEIIDFPVRYRKTLIDNIKKKGFEEIIEEVACTWFFRFIALRYMEVNNYLPEKIIDLSLEKFSSEKQNDMTKSYKYILIKKCNELGKIIPEIFKNKNDYMEILIPDNILDENFIIKRLVEDIEEECLKEENNFIPDYKGLCGVEVIGWMYQYYISEKKDEVFAALKENIKIEKENIPAATQLFTPKWIVKYMVENSLGRLWIDKFKWDSEYIDNEKCTSSKPGKRHTDLLKERWQYYLEESHQETEVEEELNKIRTYKSNISPENIRILDPCMGSGHILVYVFDLLYEIYIDAGYNKIEIPELILKNNIYGLDIDDKVTKLSCFALKMKARYYDKELFKDIQRDGLKLNICSIKESNEISKEVIDYFCSSQVLKKSINSRVKSSKNIVKNSRVGKSQDSLEVGEYSLRKDVEYLIQVFNNAKEYGSILEVRKINFEALESRIEEIKKEDNFIFGDYRKLILDKMPLLIKQGKIMSMKYDVVITNPPYMGLRGINSKLADFLINNFPISKYDLFSVYMEVCLKYSKKYGIVSMINQHSWMFLSSFMEFRNWLLDKSTFINMLHLGTRAFEENVGTIVQNVAYVSRNYSNCSYKTKVINLTKENSSEEKNIKLKEICSNISKREIYELALKQLFIIPSKPFAYWVNENILKVFSSFKPLGELAKPRQGMATSDNKRFLRQWFEVDINKIKFDANNLEEAQNSGKKWFPYNKGGEYRKWYGNNEFVINWENNGEEVKEYAAKLYKSYSRTIKNEKFYFKKGLTYTFISEDIGARYCQNGFIFDVAGSSIFSEKEEQINIILALLCSKISKMFLDIMNPTYNIQVGDIKNIPISKKIFQEEISYKIKNLVNENIIISKNEWDLFETSWDFKWHPFLLIKSGELESDISEDEKKLCNKYISCGFDVWKSFTHKQFEKLKKNEEKLNKMLIEIYGFEEELTPEVKDKDITIRKADKERDIESFISFAVGCMFGRYSTYKKGLIYNGIIDNSIIIPMTEEECFHDDIVFRFINFVKDLYGKETLNENLDFIADSIGRKTFETSKQCIKRYFLRDFYKDHLKIYKKKPIYWLLKSGKNEGFGALIYMHRYNENIIQNVRKNYIHLIIEKYINQMNKLNSISCSKDYPTRDVNGATKSMEKISKKIEECKEYEEFLEYLSGKKISIDLDDGIKVNYEKFQQIKFINSKGIEVKKDLFFKI